MKMWRAMHTHTENRSGRELSTEGRRKVTVGAVSTIELCSCRALAIDGVVRASSLTGSANSFLG